tara:strand:+ start:161 stop:1000 length:840 start_codon:yes stop_codon:yes gene_type:complete
MAVKIYRKNNYCVIEYNNEKRFFAGDEMQIYVDNGNWVIVKSSQRTESFSFNFADLQNEAGDTVGDEAQVEEYITLNTNFNSGAGGSVSFDFTANDYDDLVLETSLTAEDNDIALVYNSQGVWLINRKIKGVYIYESGVWNYANQELQNYIGNALQPNDNISLLNNNSLFISQSGARNAITLNSSNERELKYDNVSGLISYVSPSDGDFYKQLTYSNGDLSKIETYENATKSTKLFTKELTYTTGYLTQVVTTNEITSVIETKTLSYDVNGNLINITKS